MYTIGLDLAVQSAHKAVVTDEQGGFITPVLTLRTRTKELEQLLRRARNGLQDVALRVVMEPTSMAWFPIAVYLVRHDVTVYLVLVCGAKRAYETALDHECGEKLVVKYKKEEGKGALEGRYLC